MCGHSWVSKFILSNMKLSQEKIEKIYRESDKALSISLCIVIVLFLVKAICMLLEYMNIVIPLDSEDVELALHVYDYVLLLVGVLFLLSAAINIPFGIIFKRNKQTFDEQLSSHLIGVTPEQEQQILRLLKRAAKPSDGSNKMNRAEVATLLATLKSLGRLEDAGDYNNLRLWVEHVTGLKDDDKVHFNEAYKRAMDKKGDTRYTSDLEKILQNKG